MLNASGELEILPVVAIDGGILTPRLAKKLSKQNKDDKNM
jgi:hypothetical protein